MSSPVSSLTASRSSSPEPCVQPDHFYGDASHLPPSPDSDKAYLSPEDDPLAHRGIPVFKPTMAEFADFEGYMNRVECWGRRSGIVKVVPPAEWTAALPDITPQLSAVKIKSPIEQFMRGRAGLFRQENVEKRKQMSVREWAELCAKDEFRAPSKDHVGVHNGGGVQHPPRTRRKKQVKEKEQQNAEKDKEEVKVEQPDVAMASPPNSPSPDPDDSKPEPDSRSAKARNRRVERADKDASFLETFHPHTDWLPPSTTAADYTPEFCAKLERTYWRNCGLGKPAWYGADTMGSLFLPTTTAWNVASLPSTLSRLLPASTGLPGVNTPYLYFGMWRATFAWHVEDMDLFSINYIHFGAPKFWYAVPQGRANALEDTMRGYFPKDTSQCPQFLRHKSFLASPTLLAQSAVRPNHLVQHAGEFVITYPRGYHAGFNLGLNCAESVNFALDSWLDEGRKAAVCKCVDFSVRIDVDQLLEDRRIEALELIDPAAAAHARAVRDGLEVDVELEPAPAIEEQEQPKPKSRASDPKPDAASGALSPTKRSPRKRKPTAPFEIEPDPKRPRVSSGSSTSHSKPKPITLNLVGPRPLLPIPNASSSSYSSSHTHPHTQSSTSAPPPGGQKLTLRLGPRPSSLPTPPTPEIETSYPCCLCVDPSLDGLARVHDLPAAWRELAPAARVHFPPQGLGNKSGSWIHFAGVPGAAGTTGGKGVWMAHERCAMVLPETWVDEITGERVVFGVDGIVRARWTLKCSVCTRARSKMHGALIQCAKGKCPKAFHVSCAQNGASNGSGIAYKVVNEVEKEVVLLEPTPGANAAAPSADANAAQGEDPDVRVLKVIKKTEVEALCAQHNPVIVAERRANKAEGLRADILALAPLSRIKIRVSAGVFEVTLVRVHEDRRSVEVLWDTQGDVREFKWGAVILGQTSLPTTQVPDFPAPNANANPNVTAYGSNANTRGPDAHGYWANAASAARPPVITIPAPAARFSSTNAASPSSSSTPQQQQQPQTNSAQPKAQAPAHNPYSVFKYWPAPAGQYASYSVARSATAPGTQSTSAVPYVPMAQYYTGPQPWSSQYYRPGTASTSTSTSTPYYPSITVPRAAQAQASSSASASAPASDPTPTPTSAPSSTSMQDIQSTPAPAPAPSSASPTTTSAQTPTSAPAPMQLDPAPTTQVVPPAPA